MTDQLLLSRIDRLDENLGRVDSSLTRMREWQVQLQAAGQVARPVSDDYWNHLDMEVRRKFRDHRTELASLRKRVVTAPGGTAAGVQAENRDSWAAFVKVHEDSSRLFDECLDFIGGLAFRRTGLDDAGTCELADALILSVAREAYAESWNFLTVPSLREVAVKSRARLSRIRFPEWTVWTLPFTAYALGLEVIEEKPLSHFVAAQARAWPRRRVARRHVPVLTAEIFGAFVMGPAYGHAGLELRFDLANAYHEDEAHPAVSSRVHVVLRALRLMEAGSDRAWSDRVDALEDQWNAALSHAKPKGQMRDRQDALEGLVDAALPVMNTNLNLTAEYESGYWTEAKRLYTQWRRQARNSQALDALTGVPGNMTKPRDVLNAAWLLRAERPSDLVRIESAVSDMCAKLLPGVLNGHAASPGTGLGGPGGLGGQQPIPASP
jgi:hypothetical protein